MPTENYRIYYIYLITNNLNGKNYVGQRLCPINKMPETDKYMGSGVRLHWAYDKYGIENFSKEILAVCHSRVSVDILEREYIALYRSINKAEYNVADGGLNLGSTSEIWKENHRKVMKSDKWKIAYKKAVESEEYHQKLREAQRKRWSNENARKECSEKSRERWQDPEVKRKHHESAKGRKFTEETKRKIGESNRKIMLSKHLHWYTNGTFDVLRNECPKGYWPGKSHTIKGMKKKPMLEKQKQLYRDKYTGMVWWNNGVEEVRSKICPDGFIRGKLPSEIKLHWYNNGEKNTLAETCPEGFRLGKLTLKTNKNLSVF
jgi:hypothetical protein